MDVFPLTKKLVSIPSYVDEKTDEKKIGDFVYHYLKKVPFLTKIKKQKVEGERFNVIAKDSFETKLLLIAHLDTVEPRGWKQDPLKGVVRGDKLYGLGSMDMKAGAAAILSALDGFKKTKGLMLLFYCDEEYDFKGMKKFIDGTKISPELAVSAEPTDLKIWNGARGIIKVSFQVEGQTAPASRPDQGKNAILGATDVVKELTKEIEGYKTKNLGISTCNLAAISGGLKIDKNKQGEQTVSQKGDAVPDIAEVLLDIRSGHPDLKAKDIREIINELLLKKNLKLANFIVYHDLGAFYTSPEELKITEKILKKINKKVDYLDLRQMGYQDIQMINKKFKVPAFSFGPRGEHRHQPDEWVDIRDLDKTKNFYYNLISKYCSAF